MKEHTHTGAYAVIWQKDKVALVLKSRGAYMGKWDLPGGKIESGESIEEALEREVKEETSLDIEDYSLLGIFSKRTIHVRTPDGSMEELFHIGIVYEVRIKARKKLKAIYGEDTLGARWFTIDEVRELPLTPFAERCLYMKSKFEPSNTQSSQK